MKKHKYKVCVYAICKNEAAFADRWMDSMQEADMVIVTDTGSTDNTVSRLRERGAVVFVEEIKPWRFDTARNRSLSHVPEDTDICVCTDLDEVLEAGWREKLEAAWTPEATSGRYLYNWSVNPDGTPAVQFTYFKVHTRTNYTWACPVHEYLRFLGNGEEQPVFIDGMVLNHYPDETKSRSGYLPLLELAVTESPMSDRMTYYLGREYMYMARWQECIDTLTRHLELPTALWKDERSSSMRCIAKSCEMLGRYDEAYRWYWRALGETPSIRDPYIDFAKTAYKRSDWATVFYLTTEALKITERSKTYVNMAYSWDFTPYDLCAIACYNLGLYDTALLYAQKAVDFSPDDERLQKNLALVKEKCSG